MHRWNPFILSFYVTRRSGKSIKLDLFPFPPANFKTEIFVTQTQEIIPVDNGFCTSDEKFSLTKVYIGHFMSPGVDKQGGSVIWQMRAL